MTLSAAAALRFVVVLSVHALVILVLLQWTPVKEVLMPANSVAIRFLPPATPPAPPPPTPKPRPVPKAAAPASLVATEEPATQAPMETLRVPDRPPPPPVVLAPAPPVTQPAAPAPAPEPIIPPRLDAAYLENPAPPYPPASRRAGEEGRVMLRVFVLPDGSASRVELHTSSRFPRLDETAIATAKRWRFIPARQGDRAISGWVLVPINFRLET